jgi:hypothetical protein
MRLVKLLIIHGVITLAAGVVLILAPGAIPGAVGVEVPASADLVPFMLGAAEIAVAVLSFGAAQLTDRQALRLISVVIIVFHGSTAVVEAYAFFRAASAPKSG